MLPDPQSMSAPEKKYVTRFFLSNAIQTLPAQRRLSSPFRIQKISHLLIIDLHERDLHGEALTLPLLLNRTLKQRSAKPWNQTRLLGRSHHRVGLSWAFSQSTQREHDRSQSEIRIRRDTAPYLGGGWANEIRTFLLVMKYSKSVRMLFDAKYKQVN